MNLPVGYFNFNKNAFINYQLNRWYSFGFTRQEDIAHAGSQTKTFGDYVGQFICLAEEAVSEGRLKNGAFYYRAAEFLTAPEDKKKLVLEYTGSSI